MMDNLQEAYSAYQQALYHLQDPKVGFIIITDHATTNSRLFFFCNRNQSCGMVSVFSTTDMDRLNMQKKRFRK
jgi:hypothetical protein